MSFTNLGEQEFLSVLLLKVGIISIPDAYFFAVTLTILASFLSSSLTPDSLVYLSLRVSGHTPANFKLFRSYAKIFKLFRQRNAVSISPASPNKISVYSISSMRSRNAGLIVDRVFAVGDEQNP